MSPLSSSTVRSTNPNRWTAMNSTCNLNNKRNSRRWAIGNKAFGRMKSTVGWDHCPVRLLIQDNGPKLQLITHSLPIDLQQVYHCTSFSLGSFTSKRHNLRQKSNRDASKGLLLSSSSVRPAMSGSPSALNQCRLHVRTRSQDHPHKHEQCCRRQDCSRK